MLNTTYVTGFFFIYLFFFFTVYSKKKILKNIYNGD